jgi:hypothetical protein
VYLARHIDGEIVIIEIVDSPRRRASTCGLGSTRPRMPLRWARRSSHSCRSATARTTSTATPCTTSRPTPRSTAATCGTGCPARTRSRSTTRSTRWGSAVWPRRWRRSTASARWDS